MPQSNTATKRANANGVPLSHREPDACEAASAAHLFSMDRRMRWKPHNHALDGFQHARTWGGDRRHDRLLLIYDFLGTRVYDDGWAQVSTREISAGCGQLDLRQVRRDLKALAASGLIRVAKWHGRWTDRKASAYYLVNFAAMLRKRKSLRSPRPEIAELLESVPSTQSKVSPLALREQAESVPTSSSSDSVKDSGGADAVSERTRNRNRPRSTPKTARPAADKEFSNAKTRGPDAADGADGADAADFNRQQRRFLRMAELDRAGHDYATVLDLLAAEGLAV